MRQLYGQSSGRINPSYGLVSNYPSKHSHSYGRSPSFIQSRHFHADQLARDNRDLGQPSSYQSQISSSYYSTYSGVGIHPYISSQEGCRLTNNICSSDYQCCSGKCRCVRWSVMGKMSCYKKCF